MKKLGYFLIIAAALLCSSTQMRMDIGALKPIEAVWIGRENDHYLIETDTGDYGLGETLLQAVKHLKDTSGGEIYLDTATFVVTEKEVLEDLGELKDILQKDSYIIIEDGWTNLPNAAQFLRTHQTMIKASCHTKYQLFIWNMRDDDPHIHSS